MELIFIVFKIIFSGARQEQRPRNVFDRIEALKPGQVVPQKFVRSLYFAVWLLDAAVACMSQFEIDLTGVNSVKSLSNDCKGRAGFDSDVSGDRLEEVTKVKYILHNY